MAIKDVVTVLTQNDGSFNDEVQAYASVYTTVNKHNEVVLNIDLEYVGYDTGEEEVVETTTYSVVLPEDD